MSVFTTELELLSAAQLAVVGTLCDHDAWEKTLINFMEYIQLVKEPEQTWHAVLKYHINRRQDILNIPSIQCCQTEAPDGGFDFIQASFIVGDGLEYSQSDCHRAFGHWLLTDACKVVLQSAQWTVDVDHIVYVATLFKRIYAQRDVTIGDILGGDIEKLRAIDERLGPRLECPFARKNAYEEPLGTKEQVDKIMEQRDNILKALLNVEMAEVDSGIVYPFHLKRGRWRLLDKLFPPGALRPWVEKHDDFKIFIDTLIEAEPVSTSSTEFKKPKPPETCWAIINA